MQRIKEEKGITLIALVLTIVLLVSIVAVSINYAYDGISYGQEKKIVTELEQVQQAVMQKYVEIKQLNKDKEETSYIDYAKKLDISTINKYANILKNTYTDESAVDASKYYYGLTKSNLNELGIDLKKDVSEKKYTIKAEGDTVLYIVNFYYGEVLNVYYSENHKTSYSNRNLYTIGKTTSEEKLFGNEFAFYWGDSNILSKYGDYEVTINTSLENNSKDYSKGKINVKIKNNSKNKKTISNVQFDMGNITDIANVSGSPYIVEREKGVITVNTNNIEIDEQTEISFYISARIYIIFSSRKYKIN
ncbi:MAG: hypothetical protein HFJ43_04135 [Clostridia bacterium]|nr:hypothetical protein [Clostridia bacterium]